MLTFLSWDCANRTLAHAYVTVNSNIIADITSCFTEIDQWLIGSKDHAQGKDILRRLNNVLRSFITFHSTSVDDILEGRKVEDVNEVDRSAAFARFLRNSPVSVDKLSPDTHVLIEHQPDKIGSQFGAAANNKSTLIAHQLMFYYAGFPTYTVEPKLKNKLVIGNKSIDDYLGSCASAYYARKKHTKETFLYMTELFRWDNAIAGIAKTCMDDLADAALQVLAHMRKNNMFTGAITAVPVKIKVAKVKVAKVKVAKVSKVKVSKVSSSKTSNKKK
jgi:hypothetical protein